MVPLSSSNRPGESRDAAMLLWFNELGIADVPLVGGKNASLGEMTRTLNQAGVLVPPGFATTATAYRRFLAENNLEAAISEALRGLETGDVPALKATSARIRGMILEAALPDRLTAAVTRAYTEMAGPDGDPPSVAVRSSATAEDLPEASFAGQQETFLNIRGIDKVLESIRQAYASLFTDRAVVYRVEHGFDHMQVALSAGIQRMVRSDIGAAGVAFTIDTESGFDQAVFITAAYGLGETVVKGTVNPDEFHVYKPALLAGRPAILSRGLGDKQQKMIYAEQSDADGSTMLRPVPAEEQQRFSLTDEEVEQLARQAVLIEQHYERPMDIEWGKDGEDGRLYILQARPETVHSRADRRVVERYRLDDHPKSLISGRAVGRKVGSGTARIVQHPDELADLQAGEVLVADQTDPDWGPVMKRAAAIVTNRGGRACHAAIVARELGIPAVVGCGNATEVIKTGDDVTVSCSEGEAGFVYPGIVDYKIDTVHVETLPEIPVRLMMNLGNPYQAFDSSRLPNAGVGLARVEFIINRMIGIHPRAALELDCLPPQTRARILVRSAGYSDPVTYYTSRLAEGIALLAAAFAPKPVIVRTSDFKSNEYAHLLGGDQFEPEEDNPMIGFRGAFRYISPQFRDCFELECRALKHVRDEMGLTNVEIMIPFLRTLTEAQEVTELLAANGLKRGQNGLRLIMMCEIPSNVILADRFLEYFDGFSIGSNDLTQLILGTDRDSDLLAKTFDERDPAVMAMMEQAIQACRKQNKYIGICGQGPSDHPDLARWLMDQGIDSLSLNPDSIVGTWLTLAGHAETP